MSYASKPQWLIVAMWGGITLAGVLLSFIPPMQPDVALKQIATSGCGIGLSFIVTYLAGKVVGRPSRIAPGPLIAIVLSAGTALWTWDSAIQVFGGPALPSLNDLLVRRYNWVFFTLLFGLQVLVLALIASTNVLATQQRRLVEAQLTALRFQVNPHFLFNTLNALSTLVEEGEGAAAEQMIERLAIFMRVTMTDEPRMLVPLLRELEMVQAYLQIEHVRLGDRLHVAYDLDDAASAMLVPSLLLQPLVENAVKHAVAPSLTGAIITIRAHAREGDLLLVVEDRLSSPRRFPPVHGTGVGLQNVAARLTAQFGDRATLSTDCHDDGFTATIRLPAQSAANDAWR